MSISEHKHMPEPVRRMEVFTGAGRRRSWSAAEKAAIIAESMLGFEAVSKTPNNVIRTGECVLNLPSMNQVDAINRLSRLTGSNPVPAGKALRGYRYHADKFGI